MSSFSFLYFSFLIMMCLRIKKNFFRICSSYIFTLIKYSFSINDKFFSIFWYLQCCFKEAWIMFKRIVILYNFQSLIFKNGVYLLKFLYVILFRGKFVNVTKIFFLIIFQNWTVYKLIYAILAMFLGKFPGRFTLGINMRFCFQWYLEHFFR